MENVKLYCSHCGAEQTVRAESAEEQASHWEELTCTCGGAWEIHRSLAGLDGEELRRLFDERLALRSGLYASGVWRYRELIAPELPVEKLIYRGEGNTGIYELDALAKYAGVKRLWFKAQSENPSGSFKDNGMVVAVSHGLSLGHHRFACSSTGNTSASLAMYAAWSGCHSYVFAPVKGISPAKISQSLAYGATIIAHEGTYDDGIAFLQQAAGRLQVYVCNSLNPYRIEGQKSIVFELAQQLDWQLPDWLIVPGGALSNVSALGKGLEELFSLGIISKLPRIAVIQAEQASPFHQMMQRGDSILIPEPKPSTRASALNIGNPPSWRKALRVLQLTNGVTASVSDGQIMQAKVMIDRSGLGCEPASASTLAGLVKLREQGVIAADETAACMLTGHLLKDIEALSELYGSAGQELSVLGSLSSLAQLPL